jgi:phenylalanyl-tRNA synthetase beta chain
MKFTLSWLKDHLETDATLDEISRTLSLIGLEVEEIVDPAETLGVFTVARVVDAKQHPNADRLRVCQVEIAPGEAPVEVICGAPNAKTGLVGVFAPLGSYVPGTGITLEKRPVRGIVSNGMLLSERELELSEDHDGIIELAPDMAEHVGKRYIDVAGLADPVIEVAITPNRPDCTGVRGIARDLAAAGLGTLKPEPDVGAVEGDYDCPVDIALTFDADSQDACSVFAGRYVKGVKNGPSPAWLQRRLTAIGLRPISALVDMTNYISMDRGRPLHVYDADKLTGTIRARLGKAGEEFLALDGKTYTVDDTMCVIADDAGVLGLGGIIGGEASGCTEETTNVLIECAYFDPGRTAATGRKAQVQTDARYRFERGVDPEFVGPGLDLATRMLLDLCGGTPSRARVAGAAPDGRRTIKFDPARVEKLTGVDVPRTRIDEILTAIGCEIAKPGKGKGADSVDVTTPSWRPDMHGSADLVEEVIRIVGLDSVPPVAMPRAHGTTRAVLTPEQKRLRRTRRVLAGRGMTEVVTWSFIPQDQAETFGGGGADLALANPISVDLSTMRPSLLPGLLAAAERNQNRGFADLALFEIGQAYTGPGETEQLSLASGVRTGTATVSGRGRHWSGAASEASLYEVKADVTDALAAIGIDAASVQVTRDAPAWFHPGRSGTIRRGPKMVLAHFGELHPRIVEMFDLSGPVVAFELDLTALPPEKRKARARPEYAPSDLNPVSRDFAFLVDRDAPVADLINAVKRADRTLITDVTVFDVFTGEAIGPDKASIAVQVTLQPTEATLTDEDIEAISDKVVAAARKAVGAEIRGG